MKTITPNRIASLIGCCYVLCSLLFFQLSHAQIKDSVELVYELNGVVSENSTDVNDRDIIQIRVFIRSGSGELVEVTNDEKLTLVNISGENIIELSNMRYEIISQFRNDPNKSGYAETARLNVIYGIDLVSQIIEEDWAYDYLLFHIQRD